MKRILFLSRGTSNHQSAYIHRLKMLAHELEKHGIKSDFYYLGDHHITSHTMIPFYIPLLSKILIKYDWIHAGGTPSAFVACICKPIHRRPVIYDVHGDSIGEIIQEVNSKSIKRSFIHIFKVFIQEVIASLFSDYFLPVSEPLKLMLKNRGVAESKLHLIRNGVDIKLFCPKYCNGKNKSFTVTYAGQFQPYQALDDFIQAGMDLNDPDICFQIIGFTPEDSDIKLRILSQVDKRFQLIDRVEQKKLVRLLQESNILVIPRKYSRVTTIAFPTKFAEYIALGKPVIVSDVDETGSFTSMYRCGLIYRNGSNGLKKAIMEAKFLSQSELQKMGLNGRKLAIDVFNWKNIGTIYSQMLKSTIQFKKIVHGGNDA